MAEEGARVRLEEGLLEEEEEVAVAAGAGLPVLASKHWSLWALCFSLAAFFFSARRWRSCLRHSDSEVDDAASVAAASAAGFPADLSRREREEEIFGR